METTPATVAPVQVRFAGYRGAAKFAGVSPRTVRRWVAAGLLTPFRPPQTRPVLLDLAEVERLVRGSAQALPCGAQASDHDLHRLADDGCPHHPEHGDREPATTTAS